MTMQFAEDPIVPHRDRLLDVAGMRPHLAAMVGPLDRETIRTVRIKYEPNASLRVVYRIGDRHPAMVTARTFPAFRLAGSALRGRADRAVPELAAAFWTFPNDRRLTHLRSLLSPDRSLRSLLPGWTASTLVSYAPEKSAVVACVDAVGRTIAYGKLLADAPAMRRISDLHQRIETGSAEEHGLPRILAEARTIHTLFFAPASGSRIANLPIDRLPQAMQLFGAAVARLHHRGIPPEVPPFARTTPESIRHAAKLVARALPRLKHAAFLVAAELAHSCPPPAEQVLLHGDLHLKNAFLDGDQVALIDLDQAAYGPAAADIGSVMALLRSGASNSGREFLDGYAAVRPLPSPASIAWHTAAALLTERGARAITRVRMPALRNLEQLLLAAHELAQDARSGR